MAMSKETLAELGKIRRQLIKLTSAQLFEKEARAIRRAAEAVKDAIIDGRL